MRMMSSMMNNMHLLIRLVSPILGFFWDNLYTGVDTPAYNISPLQGSLGN